MGKFVQNIRRRLHPFVLLGVSLVAIVAVSAGAGIWHHNYELKHQVAPAKIADYGSPEVASPHVEAAKEPDTIPTNPSQGASQKTNTTTPSSQLQQQAAPSQVQPAVPTSASVTVRLSVNDTFAGNVVLPAGSTQCDVLQKALDAGVIASLDMRYSSQYKTFAVYSINGQGDSGSIWWTYSVNGKSPPYGCGGTKITAGDSVDWKYVKQ